MTASPRHFDGYGGGVDSEGCPIFEDWATLSCPALPAKWMWVTLAFSAVGGRREGS
jgi:hypothetical protein